MRMRATTKGITVKKGLCAKRDIQICVDRCQSMGEYPRVVQERTARAAGGGLM
jgi:hypothetical protein